MTPMKTLRTEKVCITVETETLYDTVWNYLITLGYLPKGYLPKDHFQFNFINEYKYIWVNGFDGDGTVSLAGNNDAISFSKEFEASTELGAIIEFFGGEKKPEVKPTSEDIRIAIKVGNSQDLSKIVQEFLFSKGYVWRYGKAEISSTTNKYLCLNYSFPKTISHSSNDLGLKTYDAATQFGEIIKLFETPPVPEIKVKNDSGNEYKARFEKDRVVFGCAEIANVVFTELVKAFDADFPMPSYSKLITSINIGKGVFTPKIIREIVAHPHFGEGE